MIFNGVSRVREWLRSIRVEKGYTQEQVAVAAGISRCFYTQIESRQGKKGLSPQTAIKIANTLGFDWVWFYQEDRIEAAKPAGAPGSRGSFGSYVTARNN